MRQGCCGQWVLETNPISRACDEDETIVHMTKTQGVTASPQQRHKMVAVVFYIPSYLRVYANGKAEVRLNTGGQTVAEALADLWSDCPALRDRVLTEQGEIRQHLNIFVGQDNIKDGGGLATVIVDPSEITILPAISGG